MGCGIGEDNALKLPIILPHYLEALIVIKASK